MNTDKHDNEIKKLSSRLHSLTQTWKSSYKLKEVTNLVNRLSKEILILNEETVKQNEVCNDENLHRHYYLYCGYKYCPYCGIDLQTE